MSRRRPANSLCISRFWIVGSINFKYKMAKVSSSEQDFELSVPTENGHHEEEVVDSDEEDANEEVPKIIYIDRRKLMKAKKLISENATLEKIEEEDSDSDSEGEREWRREDDEDRAGFQIDVIDYIDEDKEERSTLVCYI